MSVVKRKISKDRVVEIRRRAIELGAMSCEKKAEVLSREFGEVSKRRLLDLVALGGLSDEVFKLLVEGRISLSVGVSLAQMKTDSATKDFLARQCVESGIRIGQLTRIKEFLKSGCSMAEALGKAMGKIPIVSHRPKSAEGKSLDDLLKEILELGTEWRMKVEMAMELIPATSFEGGRVRKQVFWKTYRLRHLIREQLDFVDRKVKQFLGEMEQQAEVEEGVYACSQKFLSEKGGACVGSAGEEEGAKESPVVGEGGETVSDSSEDVRGEGRVPPPGDCGTPGGEGWWGVHDGSIDGLPETGE